MTPDEQRFLDEWDGPPLTRRAIKCLIAGHISNAASLREAVQTNRIKWLPGCGSITQLELTRAAGHLRRYKPWDIR